MTSKFKTQNLYWLLVVAFLMTSVSVAQRDVEKWKLKVALGVNKTRADGESPGYYSGYINFPTINIGLQHMFSNSLGAKLDLGYNRSYNAENSLPFKLNYTRVNAQLVYDFTSLLPFLPYNIGIVGHAGPGVSMTKPLGNDANNTYTYPNAMLGFELHYRISKSLSIYGDASYVYSLSNASHYDVNTDGFSFRGDLAYVALGLAISLDGGNGSCYF